MVRGCGYASAKTPADDKSSIAEIRRDKGRQQRGPQDHGRCRSRLHNMKCPEHEFSRAKGQGCMCWGWVEIEARSAKELRTNVRQQKAEGKRPERHGRSSRNSRCMNAYKQAERLNRRAALAMQCTGLQQPTLLGVTALQNSLQNAI